MAFNRYGHSMKVTKSQLALYSFVKKKEESGQVFSISQLIKATGWKESTFKTYLKKGQLADFISETSNGYYEASNSLKLNEIEFAKRLSQSKHIQTLGHNCSSKLAKALLHKSRDNMTLALELYNRPSLDNRMDAFVMCFCTAWEQFLKAMIIENSGENSIFKAKNKQGYRETLSFESALIELMSVTISSVTLNK